MMWFTDERQFQFEADPVRIRMSVCLSEPEKSPVNRRMRRKQPA